MAYKIKDKQDIRKHLINEQFKISCNRNKFCLVKVYTQSVFIRFTRVIPIRLFYFLRTSNSW